MDEMGGMVPPSPFPTLGFAPAIHQMAECNKGWSDNDQWYGQGNYGGRMCAMEEARPHNDGFENAKRTFKPMAEAKEAIHNAQSYSGYNAFREIQRDREDEYDLEDEQAFPMLEKTTGASRKRRDISNNANNGVHLPRVCCESD